MLRELLSLILPRLLGLLRPVEQFVIWEIYCRLGSVLSAEQLIAADIEVSLPLYCRTSSGIRWDFTNLQSYPEIYPGGINFAGIAKFCCLGK